MNNKPQKSWGEIQLAIAAIGLTTTLAFWNVFSTPQKLKDVTTHVTEPTLPPPPEPTQTLPTPTSGLVPVKIIFGGPAPKQQIVIQAAVSAPKQKGGGGGGAGVVVGGGGSAPAPEPVASTGSSKP